MTNSAKLSISFSVAAAFFLAVGAAALLFIDHVNRILDDVGVCNLQLQQAAETMTILRLHPENTRDILARIEDLKRWARTEYENEEITKARQVIEARSRPSQSIAVLEELSEYYRKTSETAHQRLVSIHQQAIQGAIILMGGGTLLLVGIMVLVRRWFINPLFDIQDAIHLAIANDPTHRPPNNEMGLLVAPVCDLAAMAKQLEDRAARAERLASIGESCARVGQNLRNLVQSMRTMAQYERAAENVTADTKAAFDYVIATANAMDRWITSLANTTRPIELKPCRQAIEPAIRDSVSLLNPLFAERHITIEFEPADSLPDIHLDRPLFEQALVAILKNALDASPDETRIVVTTTSQGNDKVRVTIADEGEGMSEEVRRRACDPFFTKRKDGVGLGLTYALRIVDLHGGKIEIESELRKGTRVHVDLPAAPSADSRPGEPKSGATASPSSKSALSASTHQ